VNSQKRLEAIQRQLCAEPGPDDGYIESSRGRGREARSAIRDLRLCGQVARILSLELHDLLIERVEPAPDASRLRVWVQAEDLSAIEQQQPRLRAVVASSIRRRRAPELVFAAVLP
jgi:ribosome-binding factor A